MVERIAVTLPEPRVAPSSNPFGSMSVVSTGRDGDDECRGFPGFSLRPTKWQASISPIRRSMDIDPARGSGRAATYDHHGIAAGITAPPVKRPVITPRGKDHRHEEN